MCEAATRDEPNNGTARAYLARAYSKTERFQQALTALDQDVELGSPSGFWMRSLAYQLGQGVAKDPFEAAAWYRKAVGQREPPAQRKLEGLFKLALGPSTDKNPKVRMAAAEALPKKVTARTPTDAERLPPRLVPQLSHGMGSVTGLAVSGDSNIVAVAGSDGGLKLWNGASGLMFRKIENAKGDAVALSKDGARVLANLGGGSFGVWDVASGDLQQTGAVAFARSFSFLAFLDDDVRVLACGSILCAVNGSASYSIYSLERPDSHSLYGFSLAPNKSSVAMIVSDSTTDGDDYVGWMELSTNGHQRIIPIPGDNEVDAVVALDGARVVASLSNGNLMLIDAARGKVLNVRHVRGPWISEIVRLDDERLAVVSGSTCLSGDGSAPSAILIVSVSNFSVLQHLKWREPGCHNIGAFALVISFVETHGRPFVGHGYIANV